MAIDEEEDCNGNGLDALRSLYIGQVVAVVIVVVVVVVASVEVGPVVWSWLWLWSLLWLWYETKHCYKS